MKQTSQQQLLFNGQCPMLFPRLPKGINIEFGNVKLTVPLKSPVISTGQGPKGIIVR